MHQPYTSSRSGSVRRLLISIMKAANLCIDLLPGMHIPIRQLAIYILSAPPEPHHYSILASTPQIWVLSAAAKLSRTPRTIKRKSSIRSAGCGDRCHVGGDGAVWRNLRVSWAIVTMNRTSFRYRVRCLELSCRLPMGTCCYETDSALEEHLGARARIRLRYRVKGSYYTS